MHSVYTYSTQHIEHFLKDDADFVIILDAISLEKGSFTWEKDEKLCLKKYVLHFKY